MKKILGFLFFLCTIWIGKAQCSCTGINVVPLNSSTNNNFTFQSNTVYCVTGNITIQWTATFEDNTTICIAANSSLKIDNQWNSSSIFNRVIINVGPNAIFRVPEVIPCSFYINIAGGGQMTSIYGAGHNIVTKGNKFELTIQQGGLWNFAKFETQNTNTSLIVDNYGTFKANGNDFAVGTSRLLFTNYSTGTVNIGLNMQYGSNGPNKFENYGTFTSVGLFSTDPTLHFKNEGTMTLTGNYDDTVGSVLSNCGTFNMNGSWGFDLQGTIINTGTINGSNVSVAFLNNSHIENYSLIYFSGITMNTSTSYFYNEGEVTFTSNAIYDMKLAGPGATGYQPSHSTSTKYGRFKWPHKSNGTGWIKGNLNLINTQSASNQAAMLDNYVVDNTVVFGDCPSCTVITSYSQCANADGTWPPVGLDCMPVNRHVRSLMQ